MSQLVTNQMKNHCQLWVPREIRDELKSLAAIERTTIKYLATRFILQGIKSRRESSPLFDELDYEVRTLISPTK